LNDSEFNDDEINGKKNINIINNKDNSKNKKINKEENKSKLVEIFLFDNDESK
jgi:hypothetical protein